MLLGNNLFKLFNSTDPSRLTSDNIPEGEYNKYCLNYADGKNVGDIVIRFSPDAITAHSLLDGTIVYQYQYPELYTYCSECKEKAETDDNYAFYNKTEDEYTEFYEANTWEQTEQHYCPFFVLSTSTQTTYQVVKNDVNGYVPEVGNTNEEVTSGYIYSDENLTTVLDQTYTGWKYTGESSEATVNYIHLPNMPTYTNGNVKSFYFVVNSSRVDNDTTSIRTVSVGDTLTIDYDRSAYVKNVGTQQNLILEFGIPVGTASTVQVGDVTSGDVPSVTNVGDAHNAIFDFVLPKGDQGDAGAVVDVQYMQDTEPTTATVNEKLLNTSDNNIYVYNGTDWELESAVQAGMIYLYSNSIYYYNNGTLDTIYSSPKINEESIESATDGLATIAVKTVDEEYYKNWVGTEEDWTTKRTDGTIGDDCICYVLDDYEEDDAEVYSEDLDVINGEVI